MKLHTRLYLSVLAYLALACTSSSSTSGRPARNGPDFAVAFPDASVLVTTEDPEDLRELLATVKLPETDAHHEQLRHLLDETRELDTAQLLALVEAVALPNADHYHVVTFQGAEASYWSRSPDGYAPVVNELLLAGMGKLSDPSPEALGQLCNKAQDKQTIVALVEQSALQSDAQEWDDGSVADLAKMLKGAEVSPVQLELCIDALMPLGRLGTARAEVALMSLSFDEERARFLQADYERRQSISGEVLLEHVGSMSFDSGRVKIVEMGAPLLASLGGGDLVGLVLQASFDSGRSAIAEHLQPQVQSPLDAKDLTRLMGTASFDSGKLSLAQLFADHLRNLPSEDHDLILSLFSFDSGKSELRQIAGW
jgi:hypothetical protein